mmetsp:Transcript_52602/g.111718  ORF Transcript_52602/g.111718 Transcript_52602/m.111718 type:complete len:193 (-) Transcript_52602:223-801(-)|eukprot:CAMPEP_0172552630 /NCGR_PEP_ID=MMETSP1067-20121228/46463_1 /TAXON_ID=265564 ORGANISM="Thalassiosira punctigera, Strain Tpunct2005C2" /NCGR_SAMPLE_ID=MMETSP1067 /ASSEMBLY_ACC=CAM_ASM_000444 /LENGTH=192 /DNA_ID=CAMNT_0013340657 /DNA_START=125 /DNA_END=703 /DNA_ORIENTATION=+
MKSTCLLLLSALAPSAAFVAPSQSRTTTALSAEKSRTEFLRDVAAVGVASLATAAGASLPAFADETLPSGVSIKVTTEGKGPKPDRGELAAIRFASFSGETKIDDVFGTPEPYYTRVGSGGLIKGVEEVLPMMRVGDRWVLTIPGNLAFGPKGRPASAGKPRIPANAEIVFDVEMVGLPGKEQELIELIGDD